MPKVSRSRVIAAPRERVWDLVSDPHHLPRWWPRASRVEDVHGNPGAKRARWTVVLKTAKGSGVRADYRCISAAEGERYVWEQDLEDTPFERIVRSSETGVQLDAPKDTNGGGENTRVTLYTRERLRGLSRLGSPMMRGATRRRLDEALDGIERALVG